jgi:hypothetical protein
MRKISAQIRTAADVIRLARAIGSIRSDFVRSIAASSLNKQMDMFIRASYLEGYCGVSEMTWSRAPGTVFREARNAILENETSNIIYANLVLTGGLSEREALRWVSEKDTGLYASAVVISRQWGENNLGLTGEAIASAVFAGINPYNAKVYRSGPLGYQLGEKAKAKGFAPKLGGFYTIVKRRLGQVLRDMYRMTKTRPQDIGGESLDAPPAFADPNKGAQHLMDAIQGEIPEEFEGGFTRAVSEFPNLLELAEDSVRKKILSRGAGERNQRRVRLWETVAQNPRFVDVKGVRDGQLQIVVDAPGIGRLFAEDEGIPFNKGVENYVRNTSPDLISALRDVVSGDTDLRSELARTLDISKVYRQEMRRRKKPSGGRLRGIGIQGLPNPERPRTWEQTLDNYTKKEQQALVDELEDSRSTTFEDWNAEDKEKLWLMLAPRVKDVKPKPREKYLMDKLRQRFPNLDTKKLYRSLSKKHPFERLAAEDFESLIRLGYTFPENSPERRVLFAGCEKLPEGPMRDNCEKSKSKKDDDKKDKSAALIRLASSLPKGSPERRAILSGLTKSDF